MITVSALQFAYNNYCAAEQLARLVEDIGVHQQEERDRNHHKLNDLLTEVHASATKKLKTIARGRLRLEDLEELAQDVTLKLSHVIQAFKVTGDLSSLVYRTASSIIIDHHRAQARQVEIEGDADPETSNIPVARSIELHAVGMKRAAAVGITPRIVHLLSEGYSLAEIADIEGVPVETLRSRAKKVRRVAA